MSLPTCLPGIAKQENKELDVFQGAFQACLVCLWLVTPAELPTSHTSQLERKRQPARSYHPNMSLLRRQGQPSTHILPLQMLSLIIHGPELMWWFILFSFRAPWHLDIVMQIQSLLRRHTGTNTRVAYTHFACVFQLLEFRCNRQVLRKHSKQIMLNVLLYIWYSCSIILQTK